MNDRERFLATMNYQPRDRCPWWEMWYWTDTLDRWHKEGLPEDVHLQEYFGVDRRESVGVVVGLFPGFKRETLEETETYEIFRRTDGVICKQFKGDLAGRMPQWLRFPMETREDWEKVIKPRLNPASPARYPLYWEEKKRMWAQRDYPLSISGGSVFGWLRNWMGLEGISQALYDDPDWVHEMMDYLADSIVATVRRAVEEVPEIDYVTMWEDMAYKAGPLISPRMFREFMLEPYKKITSFFHDHGIHLIFVDSDGDSGPLLDLWLEGGVTGFYPIERAAGMDPVELRRRYGRKLRLIGGIDKRAMAAGPQAIEAELAHVAPLVADGGYIPWCDHLVPPDVSFENYMYYLRRMKEMTLDPLGFKPRF